MDVPTIVAATGFIAAITKLLTEVRRWRAGRWLKWSKPQRGG
jgi:hypothetical protein